MEFKIYTKTGDDGTTSLLGGTRVKKDNSKIECYGTIDELNSYIGLIVAQIKGNNNTKHLLKNIQENLFHMGSFMAKEDKKNISLPPLEEKFIHELEKSIDSMEKKLPTLKNFIIPGGSIISSHIHIARTICRRSERYCVKAFATESSSEIKITLKYLNRLSDFLFVLARYFNHLSNSEEFKWQL